MGLIETTVTREPRPPKGIVYGLPGVGKTTLGAGFPAPWALNTEGGLATVHMPASPVCATWPDAERYLAAFENEAHDRQTLVVDSLDWMLRRIEEHVAGSKLADTVGKAHGGYGNGKQVLKNYVYKCVLPVFDRLAARGITVILLAHASRGLVTDADGIESERMAPDLSADILPIFVEWSDFVAYARKDGEARSLVMEETPRCIAKNRYPGMPATIPMEADALLYYVGEAFRVAAAKPTN